nr:hypothetical protein [uncultured Nitrososphaera sp.]
MLVQQAREPWSLQNFHIVAGTFRDFEVRPAVLVGEGGREVFCYSVQFPPGPKTLVSVKQAASLEVNGLVVASIDGARNRIYVSVKGQRGLDKI